MLIGLFSINCLAIQTKRLYDKYKLNWDSVIDSIKLLTFHSSGTEGYINSLSPVSWPHGPQRCFLSFNFGLSSVAYWASGMCPKQRLKHTVVWWSIRRGLALGSHCPLSLGPRMHSGRVDLHKPAARSQVQQPQSLPADLQLVTVARR